MSLVGLDGEKARRRASAYAGKFHAETTRRGVSVEPTDEGFRVMLAGHVRPARLREYSLPHGDRIVLCQ